MNVNLAEIPLYPSFDVAPIASDVFKESLNRDLHDLQPGLIAIDPYYAPGVGTSAPGGLTFREAHLALEEIAISGKLIGMEMVEINPILDNRNSTAELGAGLVCSALGQRIL